MCPYVWSSGPEVSPKEWSNCSSGFRSKNATSLSKNFATKSNEALKHSERPDLDERQVSLEDYGWSEFFSTSLPPELEAGRVVLAGGDSLRLVSRDGEITASVAG